VNFGEVSHYSGVQLPAEQVASRVVSWLLTWLLVLANWRGTGRLGDAGGVCFFGFDSRVSPVRYEHMRGV
jgi:hypothetical protein